MNELFKYPSKFLEAHEDAAEITAEGCAGRKTAIRKLMEQVGRGDPTTAAFTPENPAYVFTPSQERMRYLADKLKNPVLDIGSGAKRELSHIIPDEYVVYADFNNPPEGGVVANVYELEKTFSPTQFRSIYARALLFHTEKVSEGITSMRKVLTPGGVIIIEEPFLADALAGLEAVGVNLENDTDVKVFRSVWTNTELGITIPVPNLLLEVTNSTTGGS